jgi:hypothetical protein
MAFFFIRRFSFWNCTAGFLRWTKIQLQFGKWRVSVHDHEERAWLLLFSFHWFGGSFWSAGALCRASHSASILVRTGRGGLTSAEDRKTNRLARPPSLPNIASPFFPTTEKTAMIESPSLLDDCPAKSRMFSFVRQPPCAEKQRGGKGRKGLDARGRFLGSAWSIRC